MKLTMENRIIFIVATQYTNVGDLLINKCLVDEISKYGEVYLDVANIPEEFIMALIGSNSNVHRLAELTSNSFRNKTGFKLLKESLGITHVFKSPGPYGGGNDFSLFLKNIYINYVFRRLRRRGARAYLVGNDVIYNATLEKLNVNYLSGSVDAILCRDKVNMEVIKKANIKNVDFIPDMAFLYPVQEISLEKDRVLISCRDLKNEEYTKMLLGYLDLSIPIFRKMNLKIEFFYQVTSDESYVKYLYSRYEGEGVYINNVCINYSQISQTYKNAAYIISNRLHVLLLGMLHEAIPLAYLNNNNLTGKISRIYNSLNFRYNLINQPVNQQLIDESSIIYKEIRKVNSESKMLARERIKSLF